jgi:hypothetical protein
MDTVALLTVIIGLGLTLIALVGYSIRQTMVAIERVHRAHLETLAAIAYFTAEMAGYEFEEEDDDDDDDSESSEDAEEKPESGLRVLPFRNGSESGDDDKNDS